MLIRFIIALYLIISGSVNLLIAQQNDALDTAIQLFAGNKMLAHASWGLCVIDTETGDIYRSVNDQLSLMPASTMKTFTSTAALSLLGSNYRFETGFAYSGTIDTSGALNGNIYIIGGGDPTFGSWRYGNETFQDSIWARALRALKKEGIRSVNGRIIGDASVFDYMMVPPSWQWEDIGNYYGSGVSGLTVHENSVDFIFRPGKRIGNSSMVLRTEPEVPYLEIINNVTTGKKWSGDQVYIYGSPYSNLRFLTGTVPYGPDEFSVSGSIPDPAYYAAFSFSDFLDSNGIEILFAPTTVLQMEWHAEEDKLKKTIFHVHKSPTLDRIVYYVNMKSNNMYTEALLKTCGKHLHDEGSTDAGIKAVQGFWYKKGLDLSGLIQKDGCGLSRKDVITPHILAKLLYLYTKEGQYNDFYESLPVAGVSGSVRRMFENTSADGNLRAKSGTIAGVKAYAGYVTNAGGKTLTYALIVNQYEGKHRNLVDQMEELLVALSDSK